MRTTVVSGMLGSGKTTFIGNLLRDAGERAVVLVNDFGALGIDGEIVAAGGVEAVELPSGCVCCTLKFDLITTIERVLAAYAPAHLVIEPSGVASPSGVLEALASAKVGPATVVGLVDASEFLELHRAEMFGRFFVDQIVNADVILVNKTDLAGEAATLEKEIRLWFAEKAEPGLSSITVVGTDSSKVATGKVKVTDDPLSMAVDVTGPMKPGGYIVRWRTSGADGHVIRGFFPFAVK